MQTSVQTANSSSKTRLDKWKVSRFVRYTELEDGGLILYHGRSGKLYAVDSKHSALVKTAIAEGINETPPAVLNKLISRKFFIHERENEEASYRLERILYQRTQARFLNLIIMPTEQCNFRCVYCYEKFIRPRMNLNIRQGIKKYVAAKMGSIQGLTVSWFGGEPLAGLNVIEDLSQSFIKTCDEHDIPYVASMTTNGYLLKKDVARKLLDLQVRHYQITLDGPEEFHDRKRKLASGGSTFSRIFSNLQTLRNFPDDFEVNVRVNVDKENYQSIPSFLDLLKGLFNKDTRFSVYFRAVGQWGGLADDQLNGQVFLDTGAETYDAAQLELFETAQAKSVGLCMTASLLQPFAYKCYAANPMSMVIGSDGTIYKCTVAFDDERNHVGKILPNGTLEINEERFNLWVKDYSQEDAGCKSCFFHPACQGSACPLIRIQDQMRPCPPEKKHIQRFIKIAWDSQSLKDSENAGRRDGSNGHKTRTSPNELVALAGHFD